MYQLYTQHLHSDIAEFIPLIMKIALCAVCLVVQPDPKGGDVAESACRAANHCGPDVSAVQAACSQRRR